MFGHHSLGIDVEIKAIKREVQPEVGSTLDVRELENFGGINDTTMLTEADPTALNVESVDLNQRLGMRGAKIISGDLMTEVENSSEDDNSTLDEDAKKQCMTKQKPMGNVTKVPVLECNIRYLLETGR